MNLRTVFKYFAFTGNVLFILWVLFNAMNEGFKGNLIEKTSAVGLICLLIINSVLIVSSSNRSSRTSSINN